MAEASPRRIVAGSERIRVSSSVLVRPLDDGELLSAAIVLRLPPNGPRLPDLDHWQRTPLHKRRFLSREEYAAAYSATREDIDVVVDFLVSHGITITDCTAGTRTITVRGTAAQMNAAFGVQLNHYESPLPPSRSPPASPDSAASESYLVARGSRPTHVHRGYDGAVHLPAELTEVVDAVIGLDNRRRGAPATVGSGDPSGATPVTILDIASRYNFPTTGASGQTIGIIAPQSAPTQLANYSQDDIDMYFKTLGNGQTMKPFDVDLEVDGQLFQNSTEANADSVETIVDICVSATAAPGATINVYFTELSEHGWLAFLNRVLLPPVDAPETPATVISISWILSFADDPTATDLSGEFTSPTEPFGAYNVPGTIPYVMSKVLQALTARGISVFCASGDYGSNSQAQDSVTDGLTHMIYPSSDPYVTCCGGTVFGSTEEYVWSDFGVNVPANWPVNFGATGGGASRNFPTPSYQVAAGLTQLKDSTGETAIYEGYRFCPDISGMNVVTTFYLDKVELQNYQGDSTGSVDGTSIVAPFYAGLMAVIQSALGTSPGFLNPILYELAMGPNPPFNTITTGNNWSGDNTPYFLASNKVNGTTYDACSGWGSVDGTKLLNGIASLLFPQQLYIVFEKNTWSLDEAKQQAQWPSAFSVVLDGFTIPEAASAQINLSGSFDALSSTLVKIVPSSSMIPESPSQPNTPQRIWFPYTVTFEPTSIATTANNGLFPTTTPSQLPTPISYTLSATVGSLLNPPPPASVVEIELLAGFNPYFSNVTTISPTGQQNNPALSQDLRVFTITPGLVDPTTGQPYPQLGDSNPSIPLLATTSPTGLDTTSPFTYITALVNALNSDPTYTAPFPAGTTDPLDTLLPDQSGLFTSDSSVTPSTFDSNGNPFLNYNFAIARVRLYGPGGSSTGDNVSVFFRLFSTVGFNTDYNVNTTYKSILDANGLPGSPLPGSDGNVVDGVTYDSIPFFATGNFQTAPVQADYGASGSANDQPITVPAGKDEVFAYFGCYINVYDTNVMIYSQSIPSLLVGNHHCIVAQIAYDEAPIDASLNTVLSPKNCDKLAQRNLQITPSDNPGPASAHRIPQTFDTPPTPSYGNVTGSLLNYQSELMIEWGNVPVGSKAYIYWPQVDSSAVLSLADDLYTIHQLSASDSHTISCTANNGLTFIPIPPSTSDQFYAGLFTVDLPLGVVKGQEFTVIVRRIFSTPPRRRDSSTRGKLNPINPINSRYIADSILLQIPVRTPAELLQQEQTTLAIMKWRLQNWPPTNRWYPVLLRYISYLSGRVDGLGGKAGTVAASPPGAYAGVTPPLHLLPPPPPAKGTHSSYSGKITGVLYDRFGDFSGFILETEWGEEVRFHGREERVQGLVRFAWQSRTTLSVFYDEKKGPGGQEERWPKEIVLKKSEVLI